jgi:heme exporter protein A
MTSVSFPQLVLSAHDLGCVRGGRQVFAGLSFRLAAGELIAVRGPNGAGKSSLLRIIAGLLRPDAGELRIDGRGEDDSVIHYLGHADALKPALTLSETLRFWTRIYRQQSRVALDPDIDEAAETVGLGHALTLPVGVLSAGQRRRAALARIILSPRALWLLDEPTASLDGEGESLLARLIRGHLDRGGLVVAATHQDLSIAPHAILDLGLDLGGRA